jgi:D-glycero-beta-D-manno-heptose 1-phosphate adenylyltransferase
MSLLRERKVVKSMSELMDHVRKIRDNKSRIVLTQGTWDLVHLGHGRYLEKAKQHGDILIVGVDSDQKTRKRKGPDRPMIPEGERLEMLAFMEPVDLVILKGDDWEKWHLTKLVRPDVLIAVDGTYEPEQIARLQEFCGNVVVLGRQAETSTSARMRLMQINGASKLAKIIAPKLELVIQESLAQLRGA